MNKLKVYVFHLLSEVNEATGYERVYVYAEDSFDALLLLLKRFPCDINEYNIDNEGRDQYKLQKLDKIYPQMYAKPNYLIINNPHQTKKKQQ